PTSSAARSAPVRRPASILGSATSCRGSTIATASSSHLDALAADGVLFEHAISTSAITPMSHASIFTGLNPNRHGLRVFYGPTGHFLESSFPTMATILRSNGWKTAAFISAYPASERFGLHWGFDVFETGMDDSVITRDPNLLLPKDGWWQDRRADSAQRRGDAVTDQALEWLKKNKDTFFLWVHYYDPHDHALVPPEDFLRKFNIPKSKNIPAVVVYDPEIFFMDKQIGRIITHLKDTGEYDRTVIVVIADHGQGLGQHGWYLHRLLYQEQLRVPLIIRIPDGIRGLTVSEVVRNIDVLPTVLEVIGMKAPKPIEGFSLVGLMEGRKEKPRLAYAEALNTIDVHTPVKLPEFQRDDLFCLNDGTWKLIHHKHHPENSELYNLKTDPKEMSNLATQLPEEVTRLETILKKSGAMDVKIIEPGEPMDQEDLEKLRSLGYAGGG
ncbi:MAG: sulfatase-like hydrolase/transferase, partial [Planctomycetes bacterium]|nr:sulfatase-like hydrolase/transferase [Planctomycetota bacterium]